MTGQAVFGADIKLPGLLYGQVLRSPHAHARIRSIDTSRAEALDGVHAVVTGKDLPEAQERVVKLGESAANIKYLSDNTLAGDKVLYAGQAIAAVAANSAHLAKQAIQLIEVEYEVSVFTETEIIKAALILCNIVSIA